MPKVERTRSKKRAKATKHTEAQSGSSDEDVSGLSIEISENAEGKLELKAPKKKKSKEQAKRHREAQKQKKKRQKAFYEEVFHDLVQFAHKALGRNAHEGTDTDSLDTFCREQFGDKFRGVFAANQIPSDVREGYMIINTDPFSMPGTHWTAIADGLFYDSFDRKSTRLFPSIDLPGTSHNSSTEQKPNESNCGERCIAFLVIHHNFGPGPCRDYL